MGWHGKLLRVDLSTRSWSAEDLNMDWAHQYLGQRGLATRYLFAEIDARVDALSPENKLIFATGPLTGTPAPTGARYSVVTKSPLTQAIACSNAGGFFGAELKNAGWDMIILEGQASGPVYLMIEDDKISLHDADELWGKSVWKTEEWITRRHQNPELKISSIGRGGENQVLYAGVVNDSFRAAGRSGVGAVMGSKNLKAIAVTGSVGVQVDDPVRFMKVVATARHQLVTHKTTGDTLRKYGTQGLMNLVNETGALPTKNHQGNHFDGAYKISGEAMHEKRDDGQSNLVANHACFSCPIACGRLSKLDKNHFIIKNKPKYWNVSGGLEFESAWSLGAGIGVEDLDIITLANFICNEHGIDTISFGATLAAAMELYETGLITEEETGMPLTFGSGEVLLAMVEQTVRGEGFGIELGQGSQRLCEKYGRPEFSMTVKGQEFSAYDPRKLKGMALAYATNNRGACHMRTYTLLHAELRDRKPEPMDGKVAKVKASQDLSAVIDSAGICIFATFAWGWDQIQALIDTACDGDFSLERLKEVGERIWNLEKEFNLASGLGVEDDQLPQRLQVEDKQNNQAEGPSESEQMLPEYYRQRGWNPQGVPTRKTRQRLGLTR